MVTVNVSGSTCAWELSSANDGTGRIPLTYMAPGESNHTALLCGPFSGKSFLPTTSPEPGSRPLSFREGAGDAFVADTSRGSLVAVDIISKAAN